MQPPRDTPETLTESVVVITTEGVAGNAAVTGRKWASHSAVTYVSRDDPPAFLCVGDGDDYQPAQMLRMAEALRKAGVKHRHVLVPGMGHTVVSDTKILAEIYAFFDRHLKRKR